MHSMQIKHKFANTFITSLALGLSLSCFSNTTLLPNHIEDIYKNTNKVIGTYFVEWGVYGRNFHVKDIPAQKLTHVLYGFIAVCGPNQSLKKENPQGYSALKRECADQPDYTVTIHDRFAALEKSYPGDKWDDPIRGNFGQLIKLKKANPHLTILPSIGGWTLSDPFYYLAKDPQKRATFVQSTIEFLKTYTFFDGIDIDWEFPGIPGANPDLGSPKDKAAFTALMRELREALDELTQETGKQYQLTAATSAGPNKINNVDYAQVSHYVDYIFAMTYDFYGAWDSVLGHHTGLYAAAHEKIPEFNAHDGIQNILEAGLPASKLVLGAAMYGRGWTGIQGGQTSYPWDGTNGKPIKGSWQPGVIDYKHIVNKYLGGTNGQGINGFKYFYDNTAQAPYVWNPAKGELITYDNPRSVQAKGQYVLTNNLAGMFTWEIDADNGDILNAIHNGMKTSTRISRNKRSLTTIEPVIDAPNTNQDKHYTIHLSKLIEREKELTDTPLMQEVKASITTLDNAQVEKIKPTDVNNPNNVKRVESIISQDDWEFLFPERAKEYTYTNFLKAIGKFPAFCGDYDDGRNAEIICRKSLATMFAHFTQETGGHNPHMDVPEWRQGLHYVREMGWNENMKGGYNTECSPNTWQGKTWPCGKFSSGEYKSYFGRGAKQLSYNYNYGPFSEAMFGTTRTLLDNPEKVADTWLNLASAVFFYVYPQPPKPSMFHVINGTWQPNDHDKAGSLVPGFGATTQIINGGVECGAPTEHRQSINRINYYKQFSQYLEVPVPEDEVLGCANMKRFDTQGSGALNIYWEQDWRWEPNTPSGKSYECKLVNYQTSFSAFKEGDYIKCVKHFFDDAIIDESK
ncbi:glycosyl hydrolase family 18 protein [Zooshikella ganghwensis]|uniref:glycosyl hydrolase family 18 protein n=1 Tax=Zooshikella ganghwensis TaxID=202772 RepID=UPI001E5BB026|nr:glycosyl hydrolase family 18 protein [Zooshikella ganghwensis]